MRAGWRGRAVQLLVVGAAAAGSCKGAAPDPGDTDVVETDTDTDADSDTDADADTDTDSDADTDTDTDPDTGASCSEDANEDNDTLLTAIASTGGTALWVQVGDPDYWSFDVPVGHEVRVVAQHDALAGDIDVYVLDADGDVTGVPGATFASDETAIACNGTGAVASWFAYVEVWEASLDTCNTYDLQITTTPHPLGCVVDTGGSGGTGLNDTGDTGVSATGDTGIAADTGSTGDTGTP
ncbi:MAG: hypothetical protein R3F61_09175 [Myxococcota bacterium]